MVDSMQNPLHWERECVLVDGRFARIARPLKHGDVLKWYGSNAMAMHTGLMSELVEIDGKKLTYEEFSDMDAALVVPISNMVTQYIASIGPFAKGIA